MKVNAKIYSFADEAKPFETQDIDGRCVQLYIMNDFEPIYNEFTPKSRFAVWSSVNGTDYRLFIEAGYYEKMKELYIPKVNKIWLDFWDSCEKISRTFSFKVIVPITVAALGLYAAIYFLVPDNLKMWFIMALIGTFFIGLVTSSKLSKKQIANKNSESLDEIKKVLGAEKFENLLEIQRNYPNEFFNYDEEENTASSEEANTTSNEVANETTEVVSEEITEETKNSEGNK